MDLPDAIPGLGTISADSGFIALEKSSDGAFEVGKSSVTAIFATGDRKVEFIALPQQTLAYVTSALGYPAYYPVWPVGLEKPLKAVLMDLDGTSVHSEDFWIWIIEQTTAKLLGDMAFTLAQDDIPYVSGHSVSEHLRYCLDKYCPQRSLEVARQIYFETTAREMAEIMAGRGRPDAFRPAPDLKDFLLTLKANNIKIGLVTSGLYEKAYPEIVSAFRMMDLGDPTEFYDGIITAGYPLRPGEAGTLGELSPKPHPWLYAELCRIGLGIPFSQRNSVVGVEDSGAGVCSLRLAGFSAVGLSGGNIVQSGAQGLCHAMCDSLEQVLGVLGLES